MSVIYKKQIPFTKMSSRAGEIRTGKEEQLKVVYKQRKGAVAEPLDLFNLTPNYSRKITITLGPDLL